MNHQQQAEKMSEATALPLTPYCCGQKMESPTDGVFVCNHCDREIATPPDPQPLLKPGETIDEMGVRLYSERPDPQQAAQKCMGCGIDLPSNHPFTVCDPCWDKYPPGTPMPSGFKQSQFRVETPAQNGGERTFNQKLAESYAKEIEDEDTRYSAQPTPEPSSQQGEWRVVDAGFHSIAQHYYVTIRADGRAFDISHHDKDFLEATAKRICEDHGQKIRADCLQAEVHAWIKSTRAFEIRAENDSLRAELQTAKSPNETLLKRIEELSESFIEYADHRATCPSKGPNSFGPCDCGLDQLKGRIGG